MMLYAFANGEYRMQEQRDGNFWYLRFKTNQI